MGKEIGSSTVKGIVRIILTISTCEASLSFFAAALEVADAVLVGSW